MRIRTIVSEMYQPSTACISLLVFNVSMVLLAGCDRYRLGNSIDAIQAKGELSNDAIEGSHPHDASQFGGWICSFDNDQHHAELVLHENDQFSIFILSQDTSELVEVPVQTLTAYYKVLDGDRAYTSLIEPEPMDHNTSGTTSRFAGRLQLVSSEKARLDDSTRKDDQRAAMAYITVPGLRLGNNTDRSFVLRFRAQPESELILGELSMPSQAADDSQQALFSMSGGLYTEADIAANQGKTPSAKYAGFRAKHDPNPQPGDYICPITRTKANPACTWVINGQTYRFCCPPCIDEFVKMAKETPSQILPAESYRKAVDE